MKDNKKYEFTDEKIEVKGSILHRIKALKDFGNVKAGDLGGFIESENNLSQDGDCWVADNAKVYGGAYVVNNAQIRDNAQIYGTLAFIKDNTLIYGNAEIYGCVWITENVRIGGTAVIRQSLTLNGDAIITKRGDYLAIQDYNNSGYYLIFTKSNKKYSYNILSGTCTKEDLIAYGYDKSKEEGFFNECFTEFAEKFAQLG